MRGILLAHAAATLYMTGLVWFVQVVHYPLFSRAERAEFGRFAAEHARRTTWVVGPPMLVEGAAALYLAVRPVPGIPVSWTWAGLVFLAGIWLSTALLQVPRHGRLGRGFDERAHRELMATNWIRTALWTLRSLLALGMLAR